MKRIWLFFTILAVVFTGCAGGDEAPVPDNLLDGIEDAAFKQYCLDQLDLNDDEILTQGEALLVERLDLSDLGISSLKGIEYFTKLQFLYIDNAVDEEGKTTSSTPNKITSLALDKNTELRSLVCTANQLTVLYLTENKKLRFLGCDYNQIDKLNVSDNSNLETVLCSGNKMTELIISTATSPSKNLTIFRLECANNNLTTLKVDLNTGLQGLICNDNKLTQLDLEYNLNLEVLECSSNQLSALSLEKNTELTALSCGINPRLSELDISNNPALSVLWCTGNPALTSVYVWEDFDLATPTNSIPDLKVDNVSIFKVKAE